MFLQITKKLTPGILSLTVTLIVLSGCGKKPVDISTANTLLRDVATPKVLEAAKKANLSVDTANFIFVSDGNRCLINAGVTNLNDVKPEDLQKPTPVGLVFLNLPGNEELPQGFYTVLITGDTSKVTAQLEPVGTEGTAVTLPATILPIGPETKPLRVAVRFSAGSDQRGPYIDVVIDGIEIDIRVLTKNQ